MTGKAQPRMSPPPLIYVVNGSARRTLQSAYTAGDPTFTLSAAPGWPATPERPLSLTLIRRSTYGQGPGELATTFFVTAIAGAVCTIGGIEAGVDRDYAADDYCESRITADVVNGPADVLDYYASTAGQVLTSRGVATMPTWADPTGGGGGSGTVIAGAAGQLAYYPGAGSSVAGLALGTNLSIAAGTLNAAAGGPGTVNAGAAGRIAYYAAAGTAVSPLSFDPTDFFIYDGILHAEAQGTVVMGAANQLAYYPMAEKSVQGLTLGTNLSITGGVLNAAGGGGGSGTVNAGSADQLAYYPAAAAAVSGLALGDHLTIQGGELQVETLGEVDNGNAGQLAYYEANGRVVTGLDVGTGLVIDDGYLKATGGGSGTVAAGTARQVAAYPANGASVSGLTLGSGLTNDGTWLDTSFWVNPGNAGSIGWYESSGTHIDALELGTGLTIDPDDGRLKPTRQRIAYYGFGWIGATTPAAQPQNILENSRLRTGDPWLQPYWFREGTILRLIGWGDFQSDGVNPMRFSMRLNGTEVGSYHPQAWLPPGVISGMYRFDIRINCHTATSVVCSGTWQWWLGIPGRQSDLLMVRGYGGQIAQNVPGLNAGCYPEPMLWFTQTPGPDDVGFEPMETEIWIE